MSKKRGQILWAAKEAGRYWDKLPSHVRYDIEGLSPGLADYLDDLAELVTQPTYDEKRFHA